MSWGFEEKMIIVIRWSKGTGEEKEWNRKQRSHKNSHEVVLQVCHSYRKKKKSVNLVSWDCAMEWVYSKMGLCKGTSSTIPKANSQVFLMEIGALGPQVTESYVHGGARGWAVLTALILGPAGHAYVVSMDSEREGGRWAVEWQRQIGRTGKGLEAWRPAGRLFNI